MMNTATKTMVKVISGIVFVFALGLGINLSAKADTIEEFDLKADKTNSEGYEYYTGNITKEYDTFVKVTYKATSENTYVSISTERDDNGYDDAILYADWYQSNYWYNDGVYGYESEGVLYLVPGEYGFYLSNDIEKDKVRFTVEEADINEFVYKDSILTSAYINETYDMKNARLSNPVYETTDEKVATVDDKGILTINGAGDCDLLIHEGDNIIKYAINVGASIVNAYSVENYFSAAKVPAKCKLQCYVGNFYVPEGESIVWKVDKKNIATIDKNGLLKAKKKGKVTVTAIYKDKVIAKTKIKVVNNVYSQKLNLKNASFTDGDTWPLLISKIKYNANGSVTATFYMLNSNSSHDTACKFGEIRVEIYDGDFCIGKQVYTNVNKDFPYGKYVKQTYTIDAENVRGVRDLVNNDEVDVNISCSMTKMEWK